jgi:DNA/RNA endonuclease YhcR with UshA esterase domain
MSRIFQISFLAVSACALAAAQSAPGCMKQDCMNMKHGGMDMKPGGMDMKPGSMSMKQDMNMKQEMKMTRYDVSTETTIRGTIQDVIRPQHSGMMGTHLTVKTATETIEVHLGPSHFIANAGFSFAKGDSVQVLGSIVMMDDGEFLIAREITKDGKTLVLRDKMGQPLWARPKP